MFLYEGFGDISSTKDKNYSQGQVRPNEQQVL